MKIARYKDQASPGLVTDGQRWPVAVILTDKDKQNIASMAPGATVYASFPDDWHPNTIAEWLDLLKRSEGA